MPLSWNEIRSRAIALSKEFETDSSEDAEAKTFWDAFFNVFGVTRQRLASFEQLVTAARPSGANRGSAAVRTSRRRQASATIKQGSRP